MNAVISIRDSKITIEDSALKEIMRDIIDFEMIFCTEHIFIMYSKQVLTKTANAKQKDESEQESSEDANFSNNNSSEDDLSDVENERHF